MRGRGRQRGSDLMYAVRVTKVEIKELGVHVGSKEVYLWKEEGVYV